MPALALTDRDGLYGAVKFAPACVGPGSPRSSGVDLAVGSSGLLAGLPAWADPASRAAAARRTPVRGGAAVDLRHPRVTVLALGADERAGLTPGVGGGGCAGWSRPLT